MARVNQNEHHIVLAAYLQVSLISDFLQETRDRYCVPHGGGGSGGNVVESLQALRSDLRSARLRRSCGRRVRDDLDGRFVDSRQYESV